MLLRKFSKRVKLFLLSDELYVQHVFKNTFGYNIDLKNPKTLNEKLQWLKLNVKTELITKCSDKIEVKRYVSSRIGEQYIIETLKTFENVSDITMENLPNRPFIIKANHTSGTFEIIRDKQKIDINILRKKCRRWLNNNYYQETKEWQYKNIEPKILVETLLTDENGVIPSDFKFICINGKVEIIHVDSNKEVKHLRNHYDRNWNPLDFRWPQEYYPNDLIDKPHKLNEMITIAEKLSSDFRFVRVDLYCVKDQIYFGELTFHPTSGLGVFYPSKYDILYGEKLNLE